MIHVVITLPSGNKNCFGTDVAVAFARAQQLFPVLGTIEIAAYSVTVRDRFDKTEQHCPDPACKVGTPNKLKRYRVYSIDTLLYDTNHRGNARKYARSFRDHPSTSGHVVLFDAQQNITLSLKEGGGAE